MKKLVLLALSALLTSACNISPLDMFGLNLQKEDFEWEHVIFEQSGMKAPAGYQELGRMSYRVSEDESIHARITFEDGKVTIVFPSGGYRTVGYTVDKKNRTVTFDAPLIYATPVITHAKYDMMTAASTAPEAGGAKLKMLSFYDPSADDFINVDIEKDQWSLSMASVSQSEVQAVYPIEGEYGTTETGHELVPGKGFWAQHCVGADKLFAWVEGVDLGRIYYGPAWRYPTREEAGALIDGSDFLHVLYNDVELFAFGLKASYEGDDMKGTYDSLILPFAEENDGVHAGGIWLSDGAALVYSYDSGTRQCSAQIQEAPSGAQYYVRPVRADK